MTNRDERWGRASASGRTRLRSGQTPVAARRAADYGRRRVQAVALTTVHLMTSARLRDAPRVGRTARALAVTASQTAGCTFARGCATGAFPRVPLPRLTPRRWAVISEWASVEALEAFCASPGFDGATRWLERCELRLESVRASGAWEGWSPAVDGARPLADDEPLAALIHGVVRKRFLLAFWRGIARVARDRPEAQGMTLGFGVGDRLLTTTSFSVWSTTAAAQAFAYGPGPHVPVMRAGQKAGWHEDQLFVRFRVLGASGTVDGADPLGRRSP